MNQNFNDQLNPRIIIDFQTSCLLSKNIYNVVTPEIKFNSEYI